ncbi:hypothetical protein U9M48_030061 [Paspalum notatum var. saurae]|uniref:NB-ARC domain-containing protein n=1 Tax=Paspalum notatum var. saurae TaxID=547442 RepID=A0AAQ3U043_PASNO
MAEVLATMVLGPLLSMVKDKASSYLLDQYNVMEGMEEQHMLLKRKLPSVLDVIADAEEMANKLRKILQEIDVLITEMNTFRFEFKPQPTMSLKWRQTYPYISSHSEDIARQSRADEKEIVETLLGQVTKRIVQAAKENGCQVSGNSTLDQIKDALSGKRYLLVLDDVWNRDNNKWKMLKLYIEHGGKGSSVMTTTRDEKVAEVMGAIKAHNIKGLGEEFIKQIIEAGAFNTQAERPARLCKMVGGIAKKCSGSPLAATALGTVLRTKNTVQEWNAVLSRNTIYDEENGILPILKLSYNCLPPHMRQCFAFCAMFPKNYEIDVETLIQLWMANCFIPEQQGVSLELTDSMGKECASIETEVSQSENFTYSARHLFLLASRPETILNAYLEKGSVAIQTLIVDGYRTYDLQDWSNYRSVRALNIRLSKGSLLEPKHLHHIRYLDLSSSDIEALPEEITILYHLQTLNLSFCTNLKRLPKAMKYMAALRHLHTHGCRDLMSMPAKLGHLTSLQTLTCFIAGTSLGCSKVGELEKLDLGGELHLKQLENVAGEEARAANIGEKEKLEKLELSWSGSSCDMVAHKEVLEGLEPHERRKALEIRYYSGSKIPTWMHKLQDMMELQLHCCQNLEKLPALWELPALRFLCLERLANLDCLFSGGTPSKFQKLKQMYLSGMPMFETWWDTDEVHVGEIIFPEVEDLMISECESLTALPKALVNREVGDCDALVYWPEKRGGLLPRLESLMICGCQSLVEVPRYLPTSLKELRIASCNGLKSMVFVGQEEEEEETRTTRLVVSGRGVVRPDTSSSREAVQAAEDTSSSSTAPLKPLSSSPNHPCFLPRLEWLQIDYCSGLSDVANLPPSIKTLNIRCCDSLGSLSARELPLLQDLWISDCKRLESLPDGPEAAAYSSLRTLEIKNCPGIKLLPSSLHQRLDRLEEKELDRHLEGNL